MNSRRAQGRDRFENPAGDLYVEWDAAYVAGALSPAERREFEEHLKGCERCSGAVAELVALPGLLGSLPTADALNLLGEGAAETVAPDPAAAGTLPDLIARVRRRRRIRVWVAGIAVVASIFAGATVINGVLNPPDQPSLSVPLERAVPGPLTADLDLTAADWGTRIEMTCQYRADPPADGSWPASGSSRYGLYVTDRAGKATRVSSWSSSPGETVTVSGSIDTPLAEIKALDVRALDGGTVLLSRDLG